MGKSHNITKFTSLPVSLLLAATPLHSCSYRSDSQVEGQAKTFAQAYFNLRFKQAASLCTESSIKWITFHASNIQQEDIETLDSQSDTALCDIDDMANYGDSATAVVTVRNFLCCDSIGKKGQMCREAKYRISLRKVNEEWLVHLSQPLSAECIEK